MLGKGLAIQELLENINTNKNYRQGSYKKRTLHFEVVFKTQDKWRARVTKIKRPYNKKNYDGYSNDHVTFKVQPKQTTLTLHYVS